MKTTGWRAGLQLWRLTGGPDYSDADWIEGRITTKTFGWKAGCQQSKGWRLEGWITVRQLAGGQDYNEDNWLEGRIAMKTTTWRSGLQQT